MIQNGTFKTKKCRCEKPHREVLIKGTVRKGKNFGKKKYLVRCTNCRAQWETMSEKGLEKLL